MKKRLLAGVLILASLFLFACGNEQPEAQNPDAKTPDTPDSGAVENVFKIGFDSDLGPDTRLRTFISSDVSEFDINSVALDLNYGLCAGNYLERLNFELPSYELILSNDEGFSQVIETPDLPLTANYEKKSYSCREVYAAVKNGEYYYECFIPAERTEIPEEFFGKSAGSLTLKLIGIKDEKRYESNSATVYYAKTDEKIRIAETELDAIEGTENTGFSVGYKLERAPDSRFRIAAEIENGQSAEGNILKLKLSAGVYRHDEYESYVSDTEKATLQILIWKGGDGYPDYYNFERDIFSEEYACTFDEKTGQYVFNYSELLELEIPSYLKGYYSIDLQISCSGEKNTEIVSDRVLIFVKEVDSKLYFYDAFSLNS